MMFRPLCVLFFALVSPLRAAEIYPLSFGDASLEIPVPEGYVAAPESDEQYQKAKLQMGAEGSELLAVFVPIDRPSPGEDYEQALGISMLRKFKDRDCTKEELEQMRREATEKMDAAVAKRQRAGGLLNIQPIHDFSDRYFSCSMRGGMGTKEEGCGVWTMALIRGRIWQFSVMNGQGATPEDLIWTKDTSKEWVDSIIANNPSDESTLARENGGELLSFTYIGVIGGAIVGGIVGIIIKLTKKRQSLR